MKQSIEEPVTRKDIIDGMIDSGYAVALKTVYDAGLISKRTYEDGLKVVPEYLKGEIWLHNHMTTVVHEYSDAWK